MLNSLKPPYQTTVKDLKLDIGVFRNVLVENNVLINKTIQNQLVIPKFQDFCDNISDIYEKVDFIVALEMVVQ